MTDINWSDKRYQEYLEDIEIARSAIAEARLFPSNEILFDLYAIPSHNHQAYYTLIYEKDEHYEMVYARTEIYTRHFSEPIKMYPFSDAREAEKRPASDGRIIIGIKKLGADLMGLLDEITISVPTTKYKEKHLISLDGVFQAIRCFKQGTVIKEIVYRDAANIPLPPEKKYLKDNLDDLYLMIEKLISRY